MVRAHAEPIKGEGEHVRSGITYAAITALGIVWFLLDSWVGSRAVASGLIIGGALALALSAMPRPARFSWAPPLLVFSTAALATHDVHIQLAELAEPLSTLAGSGSDAVVLLFLLSWPVAVVFTLVSFLGRRQLADRPATPAGSPRDA